MQKSDEAMHLHPIWVAKKVFATLRIRTAEADFYSIPSHLLQKWLSGP